MIAGDPLNLAPALPTGAPSFAVTSEGKPIPPPFGSSIASVEATLNVNTPGSFTLEIDDPSLRSVDPLTGPFQEGVPIELSFGYGRALSRVFEGAITAVGAELTASRGLLLRVQGFDALHHATRGSGYPEFVDGESDDAIVRRIAQTLPNVRASVAIKGSRNRQRLRENVSGLELLQALADEYGCQFWVADGILHFQAAPDGAHVTLQRGANLVEFAVRLSTAGQVAQVQASAYDTAQKQDIVASARIASNPAYGSRLSVPGAAQVALGTQLLHADIDATTPDEAQHWADATLQRVRRSLVTAEGTALGDPSIRVGSVLVVPDLGRFSGEYVVEVARHQVDPRGYLTSFEARQYL